MNKAWRVCGRVSTVEACCTTRRIHPLHWFTVHLIALTYQLTPSFSRYLRHFGGERRKAQGDASARGRGRRIQDEELQQPFPDQSEIKAAASGKPGVHERGAGCCEVGREQGRQARFRACARTRSKDVNSETTCIVNVQTPESMSNHKEPVRDSDQQCIVLERTHESPRLL